MKLSTFNNKLAVMLTNAVSTMWCAYGFAALALISLPAAIHLGTAALISWIAQTFLQLVLLSIIMVGQDVQSRKSERRAIQDHKMLIEQFEEIKAMHENLNQLLQKHQ